MDRYCGSKLSKMCCDTYFSSSIIPGVLMPSRDTATSIAIRNSRVQQHTVCAVHNQELIVTLQFKNHHKVVKSR